MSLHQLLPQITLLISAKGRRTELTTWVPGLTKYKLVPLEWNQENRKNTPPGSVENTDSDDH